MKNKKAENVYLNAIGEYLERRGRFFWRSNNIPAFNRLPTGAIIMRALPKWCAKGLPDLFVVAAGQIYGLEVKKPKTEDHAKTYQSKEQKAWQAAFEKHGGKYSVVRTVDDVIALGL